ncbi:MAG: hypothetical protein F6K56_38660 [Moorea sp. SIO3G5]|nr:hypothetical protein [Moorena sp. SIO3G5]
MNLPHILAGRDLVFMYYFKSQLSVLSGKNQQACIKRSRSVAIGQSHFNHLWRSALEGLLVSSLPGAAFK